jgi:hypothetical protein
VALACIFCGDDSQGLTSEHVWPQWISRLLKNRGYGLFTVDGSRPGVPRRSFVGSVMPLTVRAVCRTCNSGWLSELEGIARPVLTRLICGESITLNLQDQLAVGVWITKIAMLSEHVDTLAERQFFTDRERRLMLEADELAPPYRSVIWLAGYVGNSVAISEVSDLEISVDETGQVRRGVVITLVIGCLAAQMVCHRAGVDFPHAHVVAMHMRNGQWDQSTTPIWPIRDAEAAWPPPLAFDDLGLVQLRQRWNMPRPASFPY